MGEAVGAQVGDMVGWGEAVPESGFEKVRKKEKKKKTLMASASLMSQIEPDECLALPRGLKVSLTLAHYAADGKMRSCHGSECH